MPTSPPCFGESGRQRAALQPLGRAGSLDRRFRVLDGDRQDSHLERDAALVIAAMQIAGLPETFTASFRCCIDNGDLKGARKIVDRELQRARALLEDVTKFEQMSEDD